MMLYDTFLKLFFGGQDSSEAQYAYSIETSCSDLMDTVKSYLISDQQRNELYLSLTTIKDMKTRELGSMGFSGNANSSKDVAAFLGKLGLGIKFPVTEKGNISITQEWLRENIELHNSFEALSLLKTVSRQITTLESISKSVSNGCLPVHWKTLSETGSSSFSSENYACHLIPSSLTSILKAPEGMSWFRILVDPLIGVKCLAEASQDPILASDLASDDPLNTIQVRLGVLDIQSFLHSLSLNIEKAVEKFILAYEGVGVFLNVKKQEAVSTGVISSLRGRERSLQGNADIDRSIIRAFTATPTTFAVKELLVSFSKSFYSAGCFIVPDSWGFWVAYSDKGLEEITSWASKESNLITVKQYSDLLGDM